MPPIDKPYQSRNDQNRPAPKGDEPRINHQIRVDQIRLIDADGNMMGVVSVKEGLKAAELAGLDLVEISPNASPPVCKVLDYGKYRYEAQKRANEARKKQKVIVVKEIQLRPNIDKHDLEIKMRAMHKFLAEGDKVKITMRFRGREMAHNQIGLNILNGVRESLGEEIKVEQEPKFEGKQVIMMVAPAK
jgi:translation initiation factor IF-3